MADLKIPDDRTLILAAAVLYAAAALLICVKKKKQSAAAWLVCIAIQTATVWFFDQICDAFNRFLPSLLEKVGITMLAGSGIPKAAVAVICVIINILIILLLNAAVIGFQKSGNKRKAKRGGQKDEAESLEELQKEIAAAAIRINSKENSGKDRQKS